MREAVPAVALWLGVLYALLAVAHESLLPEGYRTAMTCLAAGTSAVLLGVYTWVRRRGLRPGSGHPVTTAILALALVNCLAHLHWSGEIVQATNLMLLAVAAGSILLRPAWFWSVVLVAAAGGAWLGLRAEPAQWRWHFGIGGATGIAIGAVFRWIRMRAVGRYETALAELESTTAGLRQASLAAQSAARSRSEFLASMSRELREPIADLVDLADRLSDATGPATAPDTVLQLRERAAAAMGVVGDMLELADVDPGAAAPELTDVDIRQLIRSQAERHEKRARDKGLDFRCQVDPTVPGWARVDARRFRRVLACLLDNAVKFTLRGRIDIEAATVPRPTGGWTLRLSVRDSGVGFSEGDRGRMFQPAGAVGDGGRLGLAMARQSIESLGGQLDGFGAPGKGSVFWFELPLEQPRGDASRAAGPTPVAPTATPAAGPLRVLLVDPDPVGGRYLAGLIGSLGSRTVAAGVGEEPGPDSPPRWDLVMVDLPAPDPASRARLAEVRRRWAVDSLPVVVVSPASSAAERDAWLEAGASDCLPRPVRPTDLRQVLDRIAAGRR